MYRFTMNFFDRVNMCIDTAVHRCYKVYLYLFSYLATTLKNINTFAIRHKSLMWTEKLSVISLVYHTFTTKKNKKYIKEETKTNKHQ